MADCAAIKAELDAGLAAYKRLTEGKAVRVVWDSDRSRIEYTTADAPRLYARIQLLQAQYDACINGVPAVLTRPVQFLF